MGCGGVRCFSEGPRLRWPAPTTPEELRELIAADRERMGRAVREAGISLD
jgi:hypothetical protein